MENCPLRLFSQQPKLFHLSQNKLVILHADMLQLENVKARCSHQSLTT